MELEDFAEKSIQFAVQSGAQYCDVRAETVSSDGFLLENGEIEHFTSLRDSGLGIRILVNGAWGFFSISNPKSLDELKTATLDAVKSTLHYSINKKQKVRLAENHVYIDEVNFAVSKKPSLEELAKIGFECDKIIRSKKRIHKSSVSMEHDTFSKYFVNSEGTKITQRFEDTIANVTATAH